MKEPKSDDAKHALSELEDAEKAMGKYKGKAELANFERLVRRAYKTGHRNHRLVSAYLAGLRSVKDYDALRSFKGGEEAGVGRGLSSVDTWLVFHTSPYVDAHKAKGAMQPPSVEQIRRHLLKIARLEPPTWLPFSTDDRRKLQRCLTATTSGLHKRLSGLGLLQSRGRRRTRK